VTWSRRDLLASTTSLSLVSLAGCTDGITYSTGDSPTETSQPAVESTPQPTEEPEGIADPEESANTDTQLQQDTDQVFTEIEWFATQYPVAIARCLGLAGRVHDLLITLRRAPSISETDIQRLENATQEYYDVLTAELEPHFPTQSVQEIIQQSNGHLATIRRFSERGDLDRAEQEVSRLAAYYNQLSRRGNLQPRFSDFPIHAPLINYLTADDYTPSTPLVFVIGDPTEGYTTVARANESWEVRSRSVSAIRDQTVQHFFEQEAALFRGVAVETGRTGHVHLNVHLHTDSVRHSPIYLQRFDSEQRAQDAYSSLLEGSVFVEESINMGRTTWGLAYYYQEISVDYPRDGYVVYDDNGNVIYDEDGDIMKDTEQETVYDIGGEQDRDEDGDIVYIYFTRIGRYLIATSPSMTAWEERANGANDPVKETWLIG
jgi:hypothetical protein